MHVSEAIRLRTSIRAFKPDPVPEGLLRDLLKASAQAPSGGNLQPWRVHGLSGAALAAFKALAAERLGNPEPTEYDVYPSELWDPFRRRRFECGEDLYATLNIPREDRAGRLMQLAQNADFFGAPVGLFFSLDRKLGPPQWSDVGMFMQTFMLLAVEAGLSTCAQEFWARYPATVRAFLQIPEDHIFFSGMAVGYADEAAPINRLRTRREPLAEWCDLRGFD